MSQLDMYKLFKTQIVFVESAPQVKTFSLSAKIFDETKDFRCDNCSVA